MRRNICESEINANWHRHFGLDSYVNHIQKVTIQAQKTIFDDLIFKFLLETLLVRKRRSIVW